MSPLRWTPVASILAIAYTAVHATPGRFAITLIFCLAFSFCAYAPNLSSSEPR